MAGNRPATPGRAYVPDRHHWPRGCRRHHRLDQSASRDRSACWSDGVARGLGGVLTAGRGGPAEGARGDLLDFPAGILLEPVLVPALRAAVAHTGCAARVVWDVVFEVALLCRSSAGRPGASGVPDLGQMPELDPWVVTAGLESVVTCVEGDGIERDEQVRPSRDPGGQPPGAVAPARPVLIGRGE